MLPFIPLYMPSQEEMYSFVTMAEDQTTKGKSTVIVNDT